MEKRWSRMSRPFRVADIRYGFYEALNDDDLELAADYFETLYLHYQARGKKVVGDE